MKTKITQLFIALFFGILCNSAMAQVYPFYQNFDSLTSFQNPPGWAHTNPGFSVYPIHGVNSSKGLTREFTNFSGIDSVATPTVGPIFPITILDFDYRIVEYIGGTPLSHSLVAGDKLVIKLYDGTTYFTLETIDITTHITSAAFAHKNISLGAYAGGNINILLVVTRAAGDYFVDIDNFSIAHYTGLNQLSNKNQLSVLYPNPAKSGELISLTTILSGIYTVKIFNDQGKLLLQTVEEFNSTPNDVLKQNALTSGLYMLSVENEKNNYQFKFVVK